MTLQPTDEQQVALDVFAKGVNLAIEAGAGTGKTSTLVMLAESDPLRRGQYVAFNKAIVVDSAKKMPDHVAANTMHALAMRSKGRAYRHRLDAGRMSSAQLARRLGVNEALWFEVGDARKPLQPGYLASLTMRSITRFCQSADDKPGKEHVPYVDGIDLPTIDGKRTWANNNVVRDFLAPVMERAWRDVQSPTGTLPFRHDHYLKLWQLDEPYIGADFILYDEAQDADPVQLAIVAAQTHAQVVYVGDSQQQIYDWRGAINALERIDGERTYLSQSFRFGDEVARAANAVLARIPEAELRLRGLGSIRSSIGVLEEADAILCRSNAKALGQAMALLRADRPFHVLGGADELRRFVRAADDLKASGFTAYPDLACFTSWGEVQEYVSHDPQGSELKLFVDLVDDFGTDVLLEALDKQVPEAPGVTTVSTAHKAKGREWDRVRLSDDFEPKPARGDDPEEERTQSASELRLLYVAVTRARRELDCSAVGWLDVELSAPDRSGVLPSEA